MTLEHDAFLGSSSVFAERRQVTTASDRRGLRQFLYSVKHSRGYVGVSTMVLAFLRVRPESLFWIAEFAEHETDRGHA